MSVHITDTNVTFIHVPKTAGTSIEFWCRTYLLDRCQYHTKHASWQECQQRWPNLGRVFTVVRNPWDRAVSMYHWGWQQAAQRQRRRHKGKSVKQSVSADTDAAIIDLAQRGFRAWVISLYNNTPDMRDHFGVRLLPRDCQLDWLDGNHAWLVLRYESLTEDFQQLQKLFSCSQPLPHAYKSQHTNYRDYYDKVSREMIAEIYDRDIKEFGYEF